MDLTFENDALEKRCACEDASVKAWGPELAPIIRRRLMQLAAADSFAVIRSLPFCGLLHEADGRYVLHSAGPLRIILEVPALDGADRPHGRNEAEIKEIRVLSIEATDGD